MVTAAERDPVRRGHAGDPGSLESAFGPFGPSAERRSRRGCALQLWRQADELPGERRNESFTGRRPWTGTLTPPIPPRPVAQEAAAVARSLRSGRGRRSAPARARPAVRRSALRPPGPDHRSVGAAGAPPSSCFSASTTATRPGYRRLSHGMPLTKRAGKRRAAPCALDATFPRKLAETASISLMAARGIPSMDDFGDLLGQSSRQRQEVPRNAAAYPPGGKPVERPRSAEPPRRNRVPPARRNRPGPADCTVWSGRSKSRQSDPTAREHVRDHLKRAEVSAVRLIPGECARNRSASHCVWASVRTRPFRHARGKPAL